MSRKQRTDKTMAKVTKTSEVRNAYGQPLGFYTNKEGEKIVPSGVLNVEFTYDELGAYAEIPSDEMPSEDEILTVVNAKRVASARAAAQLKALNDLGIQKPTLEDPKVQFATMVKVLMASGQPKETAEQFANQALGTNF